MEYCVIFDCYQTLVYKKDLEKIVQNFSFKILHKKIPILDIKRAYQVIYDNYKLKHPKFNIPKERENFYINYNKELFKIMGFSISSDQALQLNKELNKAHWAIYSDVVPALKYLKEKGVFMGVIANWTSGLDKIIRDLKLDNYFDFVQSSDSAGINKPDPKIFTKILKNIFPQFDKIYYVGNDYELDIVPAREAGLVPVLIDRDNRYPSSTDCIYINKMQNILWKL